MTRHEQYNLIFNQQNKENNLDKFDNIVTTEKDLNVKNKFGVSDSEMFNSVGMKYSVKSVATTYTALVTDYIIGVSTTSFAVTVNLPPTSLVGIGKVYEIRDIGGSATSNIITIDPFSTQKINGDTTKGISTNYGSVKVVTDGYNWFY